MTSIIDEADFDAERWYRILQDQTVTVWYTAPTAIRMLMKAGAELARKYDLSQPALSGQRRRTAQPRGGRLGSRGLRPAVSRQLVADRDRRHHDRQLRVDGHSAGSMGRPLPGIEAAIVETMTRADGVEVIDEPDVQGELALRPGWPSMFRGYWNEPQRYAKCFAGGYYLTGDLARRDADGYFWFVGRKDDVIKTSGHLIGPFEVESVLMEHPAVAEAGVIGKPDPVALEIVKAFVSLRAGYEPSRRAAARVARAFARARLGAVVAPKEIDFRPRCRRRAAARSCAACSRHASWVCPRVTYPRSRRVATMIEHGASPADPRYRVSMRLALLREMLLIRRFEEKCAELYSVGKIHGFLHLYIGEEAVAVGAMQALEPEDDVVSTYREHGHALARGVPAGAVMAEMYGKANGCSRGRGGSMHLFDVSRRFYGGNAIVGGGLPLAVGLALADKLQQRARDHRLLLRRRRGGRGRVSRVAESGGTLEPAGAVSVREQSLRDGHWARAPPGANRHRSARPDAAGVAGLAVDGMDVLAVESAVSRAADAVRTGQGPLLARSAHVPLSRALDVRRRAVSQPGTRSSNGRRVIRSCSSPRSCARRVCSPTPTSRRSRPPWTPRSPRRWPKPKLGHGSRWRIC